MKNNLDYYRAKLKTARQKILSQIENFTDHKGEGIQINVQDVTGDLSNYDNHPGDQGTTTFEREKDLGLQGRAKFILQMIEDALEEIETGQYGSCDSCGQEISTERLEAIPYSTLCKECKEEWEAEKRNWQRPIEEETLNHFPRRNFSLTDEWNNNSYDGEDTWQDLAQVGTSNTPSDVQEAHDQFDSYIEADE